MTPTLKAIRKDSYIDAVNALLNIAMKNSYQESAIDTLVNLRNSYEQFGLKDYNILKSVEQLLV